ncbi:MAG: hypothetical protein AABY87_00295 [bacterium]
MKGKRKKNIQKADNPAIAYAITAGYFLLILIGILHHEMWRDEHQAWLVARDAHSISGLFQNLKYEGNPALWHLCLYVISSFTSKPVAMQIFHVIIAVSYVFLFCRYAPFSLSVKILFVLSYFVLYEYALISRGYGLGVLIAFLICVLFPKRNSNLLFISLLLLLLANTTVYGLILSSGLAGIIFITIIKEKSYRNISIVKLTLPAVIFMAGIILSLWQLYPKPGNSFPVSWSEGFDKNRFYLISWKLFSSYFPIPDLKGMHFWNTNVFTSNQNALNPVIPIIILSICICIFIRKPLALLFYAGCTAAFGFLFYWTLLVHARYYGHFYLVLIISFWIARYCKEANIKNTLLRMMSGFGKMSENIFLVIVLAVSAAGGITAFSKDFRLKFSTSKEAARYIIENGLDNLSIVGSTDFVISPLSSYLNRPIYYPERKSLGSFVIWDNKRNSDLKLMDIFSGVLKFMEKGEKKVLVVLDNQSTYVQNGQTFNLEHAMLSDDVRIDLLKYIPPGIVEDEKYYIFITEKILQPSYRHRSKILPGPKP